MQLFSLTLNQLALISEEKKKTAKFSYNSFHSFNLHSRGKKHNKLIFFSREEFDKCINHEESKFGFLSSFTQRYMCLRDG